MSTSKRIAFLILILALSLISVLVTVFSRSTNASQEPLRGKILRAKDKFHVRPTVSELRALRERDWTDNERRLENKIPNHLPLKVKIRREKLDKFKDLGNEHWARDLELEVKNTGEKPIYFVEFSLILPEVTVPSGLPESFSPTYGRDDLGSFENKAQPSDVPIKPGETVLLKIDLRNVAGYEAGNRKWQRQLPKRVELTFQMLNFGDGTGFVRSDGLAVPHPNKHIEGMHDEQQG